MNRNRSSFVRASAISAAAIVIAHAATALGAITYTPIALSGTDGPLGPGMGAGVVFGDLSSAVSGINNAGSLIFRGATTDATNSAGVWTNTAGTNNAVAFAGAAMPDGGTYPNTGFNAPVINNAGQAAWRQGTNSLFSNSTGADGTVARTGTTAPGTGGATLNSMSFPAPLMAQDGRVGFIGGLLVNTGTPPVVISGATANAGGVWIGRAGSMQLAMRQNDPVTAIAGDGSVRVGSFTSSGLSLSNGGKFLSLNALQGSVTTGATAGNDQALLTNRNGTLEVVARRGDQAAGAPTGEFYRALGSSTGMNNAGRVVFSSSLRDAAGVTLTNGALFSDNNGSMRMVARGGTALPTISGANGAEFDGVNWGTSYTDPVINGNNVLAFKTGGMTGTGVSVGQNDSAIFTCDPTGTVTKIVRNGDTAPVGPADDGSAVRFGSFQGGLSLNARGQVAFVTLLSGFGVNGLIGNNLALFATDLNGVVQTIVRRQSAFEVAPGDVRTVASIGGISTTGGQDGRGVSFNDYSVLTFSLGFTDGTSGVFTATVPAPGGLAVAGLGGLLAFRRRR